ncbi:DUF6415 family natural product biosynthesis protein [[Kitasatospora] papulosa]|uniref:DUF6415 family natural product biosynthesis protein n=1 Tax=[Kitasatospora] papulosa TaxID=1464011 RepID=UPI003683CD8D
MVRTGSRRRRTMISRTVPGEPMEPVDTRVIRRLCFDVLWMPLLPTGERLDALCEELTGHTVRLIPEVMGLAARMLPDTRRLAVHCLVRAHQDLAARQDHDRLDSYAYYLATSVRALLTLVENPGPLGAPAGEAEIEEAVRRKMCAGCCPPAEGSAAPGRAASSIPGYRHADGCRAVAAGPGTSAPDAPAESGAR